MKTKTLITCDNIQEAALIKGNLENEGIPSMLTNQNFSTMMPNFTRMLGSGVQVLVFEKDIEKAVRIISPTKKKVFVCPFCGSENITFNLGKRKAIKIILIAMSILTCVPISNNLNTYYCKECKSDFKE